MAVNFRAIADPDVIFFIAFYSRKIKNFCAVFDKGIIDDSVAIDLRLMHHARVADGCAVINVQNLVAFTG
ncbi:hypothetical protein D3C73_1012260 [compost metagenome]